MVAFFLFSCLSTSLFILGCRYTWTQTLGTVDVYVHVPAGTKASQCDVKIAAGSLRVALKGQNPPLIGKLLSSPLLSLHVHT